MFRGVDAPGDPQDFLRGRDFVRIDKAIAMMSEAYAEFPARKRCEHNAARAAGEIEDEVRAGQGVTDFAFVPWRAIRIAVENFGEARFDDHADFEVGPMALEQSEGGSRQD